MIKPKRQSKTIIKQLSPSVTPPFSIFRLATLHFFLGLVVTIGLISLQPHHAMNVRQHAEPATTEATVKFFTPSLFPTQTPVTHEVLPLNSMQLLHPLPAPAVSEPAIIAAKDYCLEVPVLVYHHVQPLQIASLLGHKQLTIDSAVFEDQIVYLKKNGYQALTAKTLVNALINREPLPEKSILITIDDGYDDNYTYAFLTAKKHQFVMNFMIPTQLIGKPGYMNWDHLREMQANEFAAIYNHTATHAPLGNILKPEIEKELITATDDFQRELGLAVNLFTYPYGSYNPIAIQTLKDQGFIAAFTTDDGQTQCASQIMQLKRTRIGNAPLSNYGF